MCAKKLAKGERADAWRQRGREFHAMAAHSARRSSEAARARGEGALLVCFMGWSLGVVGKGGCSREGTVQAG